MTPHACIYFPNIMTVVLVRALILATIIEVFSQGESLLSINKAILSSHMVTMRIILLRCVVACSLVELYHCNERTDHIQLQD
jgi:hypothetical protein